MQSHEHILCELWLEIIVCTQIYCNDIQTMNACFVFLFALLDAQTICAVLIPK